MIIPYGVKTFIKDDIWAGKSNCPNCGISDFHLKKLKMRITIFFIPIMSITTKRFLVCDTCDAAFALKRKKYNEIRKEQINKLKNNEFPENVILNDFAPKKNKLGLKLFLLVLALLFSVVMLSVPISTAFIPALIVILPICLIPTISAINNFLVALTGKRLYENIQNRTNM